MWILQVDKQRFNFQNLASFITKTHVIFQTDNIRHRLEFAMFEHE